MQVLLLLNRIFGCKTRQNQVYYILNKILKEVDGEYTYSLTG